MNGVEHTAYTEMMLSLNPNYKPFQWREATEEEKEVLRELAALAEEQEKEEENALADWLG